MPWRPARACFRHERDLNYLEDRDCLDRAEVDKDGIRAAGMTYRALILEHDPNPMVMRALEPMARADRIIRYTEGMSDAGLMDRIGRITLADVRVDPPALRVWHVRKSGLHWYMLFNEENTPLQTNIDFSVQGDRLLFDAATGQFAGMKGANHSNWPGMSYRCF